MIIATTIPDDAIAAWQARVDHYNAGSKADPVSIQGFCQILRDEETERHLTAKKEADKTMLGSNEKLISIGLKVVSASPEKQEAAIAAAEAILDA